MPSTSTLSAAGAVLGFLAGFALAAAPPAPLIGEATPYDVSVEWRAPATGEAVVVRLEGDAARDGSPHLLVRRVVLPAADAFDGACARREAERRLPRRT